MLAFAPVLLLLVDLESTVSPSLPLASDASAVDPDKKIRCRTYEVTGSLADRKRICKTVAKWREDQSIAERQGREMTDKALAFSKRLPGT
jgi:hypothetical protein